MWRWKKSAVKSLQADQLPVQRLWGREESGLRGGFHLRIERRPLGASREQENVTKGSGKEHRVIHAGPSRLWERFRIQEWRKGIGPFYTSMWYVQVSLEKDHSGCWVMPRVERGMKLGGLWGECRGSWGEKGAGWACRTRDGEEGTGNRWPTTSQQDWVRSVKQRQQSKMMLEFSVWVTGCHFLSWGDRRATVVETVVI